MDSEKTNSPAESVRTAESREISSDHPATNHALGLTSDGTSTPTSNAQHVDETKSPAQQIAQDADTDEPPPYSAFTHRSKKLIISAASIAALMSPLSSNIYLPAVEQIAAQFHQSNTRINLTITCFLIMQGIAPTFVAAFSDELGRRPAYLVCFPIFIAANIGLALAPNYAALLGLRCMQSTGSSGTVTLSNAIVADLVTSAERGVFIGFAQIGTILGPAIGPILGGVISQFAGWTWIFWFLTILSLVVFIPILLFLPETCRKVVGDGHKQANAPLLAPMRDTWRIIGSVTRSSDKKEELDASKISAQKKPKSWNPLASLKIMLDPETALLLFCNGVAIACFIAVTTSIPSQFKEIYHYNELETSLVYLPISAGGVVSAFSTGKFIDRSYKRHARRLNLPLTPNRQRDLATFPIERARLEIVLPLMYLAAVSLILYGWVLHLETTVAGPVILLFFFGYAIVAAYQVTAILLVDLNPGRPATATAANNLVRCSLSAGASAAIDPMIQAMGRGWTFTTWSLIWVVLSPCVWLLMIKGPVWRAKKRERRAQKEAKAQQATKVSNEAEKQTSTV